MTNYQRGRSAEYKAVKELQAAGYIATRSAGSHGLWDVMAVNKNGVRLMCEITGNDFTLKECVQGGELE